jgi:ATP-dependent Clp protease ATP-binding subunit ClpC
MEYTLDISTEAVDYIASEGFDPEYGARPLKRAIQRLVEDVLTEEIIQSNPSKGSKLSLTYNKEEDKMIVEITSAEPKKEIVEEVKVVKKKAPKKKDDKDDK